MATPVGGTPGRERSKSLFFDYSENNKYAIYYLDEFHDTFIDLEDITEYKAAIQLVGSWKKWGTLKRDWPAFAGFINEWKEELEVKFRSDACANVLSLQNAESESVQLQAAKFLSSAEWDKRTGTGAGRPNKKVQKQAAREVAELAADTKQDRERVLKLMNGGK
jgi:hypothetical protein